MKNNNGHLVLDQKDKKFGLKTQRKAKIGFDPCLMTNQTIQFTNAYFIENKLIISKPRHQINSIKLNASSI